MGTRSGEGAMRLEERLADKSARRISTKSLGIAKILERYRHENQITIFLSSVSWLDYFKSSSHPLYHNAQPLVEW